MLFLYVLSFNAACVTPLGFCLRVMYLPSFAFYLSRFVFYPSRFYILPVTFLYFTCHVLYFTCHVLYFTCHVFIFYLSRLGELDVPDYHLMLLILIIKTKRLDNFLLIWKRNIYHHMCIKDWGTTFGRI